MKERSAMAHFEQIKENADGSIGKMFELFVRN